jgi:FtsH-binding integral membrane protein
MEFDKQAQQSAAVMDEGLRAYMLKVYNYMATGILLTGIIALISFKMSVVTDSAGAISGFTSIGNALFFSGLKWIVMLAPLGIVFYMSFGINKMSASKAQTVFWVYSALMGLHRCQCCKSIFYNFSNFWSNEFVWLYY